MNQINFYTDIRLLVTRDIRIHTDLLWDTFLSLTTGLLNSVIQKETLKNNSNKICISSNYPTILINFQWNSILQWFFQLYP
jgi:hypothetical protein